MDRANNFNLTRLIAALAVIVGHSFPLTGDRDPSHQWMAGVAVDAFFVVSGFLVTGSLLARGSAAQFSVARFLRIYPALIVAVLLTAFGVGAAFTALPLGAYFTDPGVVRYLAGCLLMPLGFDYALPGAFADVPFPHTLTGSLWTLPYEVRMYALLGAFWVVLGLRPDARAARLRALVLALAGGGLALEFAQRAAGATPDHLGHWGMMFFVGASFKAWAVPMRRSVFWPAAAALALGQAAGGGWAFVTYTLALPYALLYLATVPAGPVRAFNRVGDYSYGVYIYGFPVQQIVAALAPGVSPLQMMALAIPVSLGLAYLSWHLVERPALNLKPGYRPAKNGASACAPDVLVCTPSAR